MSRLIELPTELLEHNICQHLDVWSISQLGSVNRRAQNDLMHCSDLWEKLVARYFGYMNKPALIRRPRSNSSNGDKIEIGWKALFVAAWRDALALAPALQECDVLQVYNHKCYPMPLQPREVQIRREIMLMQGLRQIPTS